VIGNGEHMQRQQGTRGRIVRSRVAAAFAV
jgi:hypothetical protein